MRFHKKIQAKKKKEENVKKLKFVILNKISSKMDFD